LSTYDPKEIEDVDVLVVTYKTFFYIERMLENKYLRNRVYEIGLNDNSFRFEYLIHSTYQRIIKFSPDLQKKLDRTLALAKPTPTTQLYCAQIRVGEKRTPEADVYKFWEFIKEEFMNNKSLNDYRIFITTNNEFYIKDADQYLDPSKIVRLDSPSPSSAKTINTLNSEGLVESENLNINIDRTFSNLGSDCSLVAPAMLDFHILQYCDKIVNSESGFGIYGGLNRIEPFKDFYIYINKEVLNGNVHNSLSINPFYKKMIFIKLQDFRRFQYNYKYF
jgi:hypothetical protein